MRTGRRNPFRSKPPALARNTFTPDEIATVTPEHEKYCRDLLAMEGGALTGGPFAQYGPKLRVIFPGLDRRNRIGEADPSIPTWATYLSV